MAVLRSARRGGGGRYGCNIGPLGLLCGTGENILKGVQAAPPVLGMQTSAIIIDNTTTVFLPPELALRHESHSYSKIVGRVQARLRNGGIAQRRGKLKVIFPGGVDAVETCEPINVQNFWS